MGCCGWALPTISSPWMHDSIPALEVVFENISSTDTNCYSRHPSLLLPCPAAIERHKATSALIGNQRETPLSTDITGAYPQGTHRPPSLQGFLLNTILASISHGTPVPDKAAGLQSSSCIPRCPSPAPQ